MTTASRLPQRQRVLALRPDSVGDTRLNAGQVYAAFAEIGYHSSTVQELERMLQGPVGDGIQILAILLIGHAKVAHIRSELQRIKKLPPNQSRTILSASTTVERHANASSKLSRTRKEMAARQQELATLHSTLGESLPRDVERTLGTDRTTTLFLRVLQSKELLRVSRIGHVHRILNDMLENARMPDVQPNALTLPAVLAELHRRLPGVSHNSERPLNLRIIKGTTSSALTLKTLYSRLQEVSLKLATLGDEAASDRPSRDDLLDILTLLRIRHNTLKRSLPLRTSTPALSDRLDASLAKSLGCSPSDPDFPSLKKNLVASCETRVRDQLRKETQVMLPKTLLPSVKGLEDAFAVMDNECRRAQALFSLYQYLFESAMHLGEKLQDWDPGRLHDLRTECQEKEKALLGYVDVQRRRITQSLVGASSKCHDGDIHGALGLPPEMGSLVTLKNITDMISQTVGLRQVLSGKPKTEVPVMDARVLKDFDRGKHEVEKDGMMLLRRKNEKMEIQHVLEADIKRFLDERDAIIGGKLSERNEGRR